MKLFGVLLLCALLGMTVANPLFESFREKHRKKYYTKMEYVKRLAIFNENLERIRLHNEDPTHSWKMGMNQFGDLTAKEFKQLYVPGMKSPTRTQNKRVDFSESINLPPSIDWREHNAVSPVKDQGSCGSCWAFSTTGSVEGAHAIKTGELLSLSEQQLVDCGGPEGSNGCGGGLMDFGFQYVEDAGGLCLEKEYPYEAENDRCGASRCSKFSPISRFIDVDSNNEMALKAAVAQQPVSVAIEADITSFQFYESGVFDIENCGTSLDHGVLVVGYGVENQKPYWLVKNSWGASWGDSGYIKIRRSESSSGPGMCGIAMCPSYPIAGASPSPFVVVS